MNKLLVICGPTATGKTSLGVALAKRFDGELISADSRQVYRGMDIGTGKDIDQNEELRIKNDELGIQNANFTVGYREKEGVPIWLLDIIESNYVFNVGEYKQLAQVVARDIQKRNKLPIVVGGTGLYVRSLLDSLNTLSIPPDVDLRKKLDVLSTAELQKRLQEVDLDKFTSMNRSDQYNPRRLVRAIEIGVWKKNSMKNVILGRSEATTPESPSNRLRTSGFWTSQNDISIIGLSASIEELEQRVDHRVEERMKQGIAEEVKALLSKGYTWDLPSMSGLGYKEWKPFFENSELNDQNSKLISEIIQQWKLHEKQYAKRQITYFKKLSGIVWFDIAEPNYLKSIEEKVQEWYTR